MAVPNRKSVQYLAVMSNSASSPLGQKGFVSRHVGPSAEEISEMLDLLGHKDLEGFIDTVVPQTIRSNLALELSNYPEPYSEKEAFDYFKTLAAKNKIYRSYIGCGYYGTNTPAVIQRNILENPGWYTQYTPYQPEISQGRLEALLNFQTMVCSLTRFEIANASLLDEATAAAEAMYMAYNINSRKKKDANQFLVDPNVFPQTLAVVETRAKSLGIEVVVADYDQADLTNVFGVLIQYPGANGQINDLSSFIEKAQKENCILTCATDLLALAMLRPPANLGFDIAFGSSQRFGVPVGFGGPHAAFFACKKDFQRLLPGRLVGVSKDRLGNDALRLALQTREQHIRREKATSNICTAQVLLAIMSSMYAVYQGPKEIKAIAERVNKYTAILRQKILDASLDVVTDAFFDTLEVRVDDESKKDILKRAKEKEINLGEWKPESLIVSLDETVTLDDLSDLIYVFTAKQLSSDEISNLKVLPVIKDEQLRKTEILTEEVFNRYHTETEFLRYLKRLESKDLSLAQSMIPLGSCTMKLNATTELLPVTLPEFSNIHPFAPFFQTQGYLELISNLEQALLDCTGFDCVSLQPNAGSQGEYAGLIAIKAYLDSKDSNKSRNICLIPKSAHGTNPASATIAGMEVVVIECDQDGNIDLEDLNQKAKQYSDNLAALMITYPSTHGVFEKDVKKACAIVHDNGGQVYLDGANLNAMVGLSYPSDLGADVMHINLHKTFCIPHGGGGPGVGPIAGKKHLEDFFPSHPMTTSNSGFGPVSAAPYGSPSILPISLAYIIMMGAEGLTLATQAAILNANYIAKRLENYFPVLYRGEGGLVAHECILDCRSFKQDLGIEVEDIAKRLMDYGFHAPTVSWPVIGTIMIEPTESESKAELDRFCDAMISIYNEIEEIKKGTYSADDNPLKGAPHTAREVSADTWEHSYSRELAAYPSKSVQDYKFWPTTARIDSVYGDRNLVCTCPSIDQY